MEIAFKVVGFVVIMGLVWFGIQLVASLAWWAFIGSLIAIGAVWEKNTGKKQE